MVSRESLTCNVKFDQSFINCQLPTVHKMRRRGGR